MLDELLAQRLPIRAAWGMDIAHHSASYVLNEDVIGDEPNWLDGSRDMIQMVNYFGPQMPPPIYGIGTSLGGANILMMSIHHPRLFAGMVLIEPIFETGYRWKGHNNAEPRKDSNHHIVRLARRRDVWPSREDARAKLRKSPYYASFDPRVFDLIIKYDLRDMPTPENPKTVTLTTPKSQEVYTFGKPDPPFPGYPAAPEYRNRPDYTTSVPGFYRGEVIQQKLALPQAFPPIHYLWGAKSEISNSDYPQRIIDQTGVGEGGGGGVASDQVTSRVIEDVGHAIPLESPGKAAEAVADWLRPEIEKWNKEAKRRREQPPFNPGVLNPLWSERLLKL